MADRSPSSSAAKGKAKRKRPPNDRTGVSGASKETGARRHRMDPPRNGVAGRSIGALQRRAELGEDVSEERAYVRLGKTNTQILVGTTDLAEWDDEELLRGQRKAADGTFVGRPPKLVPKAIHDELVRRTMSSAAEKLRSNLVDATTALTEIATDAEAADADRLRAISMIMDRVMGKTPDRVEVSAEMPWLTAITEGIVSVDDDIFENIIETDGVEVEDAITIDVEETS